MTPHERDRLAIDTIRLLAADAVQKAKSGHPGTPMGAAPTAYTLWQKVLRYDPRTPHWLNRDRFVLSCGHASALLYALLHLADVHDPRTGGAAVSMEDLQRFRQAGSRCPGHPEHGLTAGVETTTGPLGQGVATSVGMAIAGQWLAATYNRPGHTLFDYTVYALCGDGDLMEGITAEAAALAGHLGLGNLCWIYDSNRITIEGGTDLAVTEDVPARFRAQGWHVLEVADANDTAALEAAYLLRADIRDRPTLIIVHSHIGYGAPHRQDTPEAHGEPLGEAELAAAKQFFGFDPAQSFVVPDGVRDHIAAGFGRRGAELRAAWDSLLAGYRLEYPKLAAEIDHIAAGTLPAGWEAALPTFPPDAKGMATRDASGKVLNALGPTLPWLLGGAADLAPSTKTRLTFAGAGDFQPPGALGDRAGRNLHYGVREHAMVAAVNGMVLSGLRAFGSGFLVFTDYARGAIRLAALMELPALHVWTHDSIGVGEDGPTHQPIEHLVSLRAIPNLLVLRPADANEVVEAYRLALAARHHPTAIICSRQALPVLDRAGLGAANGLARGGYVLAEAEGGPARALLIASGSEVALCLEARAALAREGIAVRVVSMPCPSLFDAQAADYRADVLPPSLIARVIVEAASPLGWDRYAGPHGTVMGMSSFGISAPAAEVAAHFGFTAARVAQEVKRCLARLPGGA
jgi:transketolase